MFYSIRHITRYRYDAPVRESIMQLYMQPKSEGPQRLCETADGDSQVVDRFGVVLMRRTFDLDLRMIDKARQASARVQVESHSSALPLSS